MRAEHIAPSVENVDDEGKRPEYSGVVGELKRRAECRHQADFAVKGKKDLRILRLTGNDDAG